MKPILVAVVGGVLLGVCLDRIYQGLFVAMMVCRTPGQSPMCGQNEVVTGWAIAGAVVATAVIGIALRGISRCKSRR